MDGLLTQVGVGGIFAVLVIKEVFSFLKSWNGKRNGNGSESMGDMFKLVREVKTDVQKQSAVTQKIYDVHDVKDADGVPLVYVRRSMEEAVTKVHESVSDLSQNVQKQTVVLERIASKVNGS